MIPVLVQRFPHIPGHQALRIQPDSAPSEVSQRECTVGSCQTPQHKSMKNSKCFQGAPHPVMPEKCEHSQSCPRRSLLATPSAQSLSSADLFTDLFSNLCSPSHSQPCHGYPNFECCFLVTCVIELLLSVTTPLSEATSQGPWMRRVLEGHPLNCPFKPLSIRRSLDFLTYLDIAPASQRPFYA